MSEMSMHATFFVRGDTPIEVRAVRIDGSKLALSFNFDGCQNVNMHVNYTDMVRLVDVLKNALVRFGPAGSTDGRDEIVAELRNVMRQGCGSEVSETSGLQAV